MKFEIYQGQNNNHFFQLVEATGEIVLLSEEFQKKETIIPVIESLKKIIRFPSAIEKKQTAEGDYFFKIKDTDGKLVCKSVMFYSSINRDKWINDIQKILPQTEIVEI